jgi:hypothetical protein
MKGVEEHFHCELCGIVIAPKAVELVPVRVAIVQGPQGPGIGQIPAPVCVDCRAELSKQAANVPSKLIVPKMN